jgi:glycosyltransferase involved in cell wall biosynthesis
MKVLLSAIACQPNSGSEAKVGWDTAVAISQIPEVDECHVMTHSLSKESIKREQSTNAHEKLHFHFFDKPFKYNPSRLLARLQSWFVYRDWQIRCVGRAARLHRQHGFSLAHHVTYASWRIPPRLWRLPMPFVFGPVGGGTSIPPAFQSILGPSGRAFETLREAATLLSARSRALKLCCANSAAVVAADAATADFLRAHGAARVHQLCQVFFSKDEAARLTKREPVGSGKATTLKIFAGGNLEGRKGTRLALQALAGLKHRGIPFSYTYGGWGPELSAMRKLAQKLGIEREVSFHEGFSGSEYLQQLTTSDVYLLPSIRETAGITMMEAAMAGCYPIVLAGTGAGDIIGRIGGTAIQANTPEEAVHRISNTLEWCYRQPIEMRREARSAGENVKAMYSEECYQDAMSEIYSEAVEKYARRT